MYPYRPYSEVNDFYDSIQAIHDNFDSNENFGKHVQESHHKNITKSCSYNNLMGMQYEDAFKKSFSSSSFQDSDYELQNYFGKSSLSYKLEDHSTKASLSSITSFNSPSSVTSVTKATKTSKGGKNRKGSGGKKKKNAEQDYRKKYKTEFCKYWAEKGFCEFGDQCAFAHGNQEVRQKQHVSSNYKTKKCNQFHETGFCPYGVRCQFVHCLRKDCHLNPILEKLTYAEAMENPELWLTEDPDCVCTQKRSRPRLPSFQQLSNCDVC